MSAPFGRRVVQRQCLRHNRFLPSPSGMDDGGLSAALERAEQALVRIERALEERRENGRDEELRAKVREAVAELDQLIRAANG